MNLKNSPVAGFFKNLSSDLPAGLVVFLVALPLCLGIALASGAPLFSGVIAGIVGGVVVALVSGSALGVSGPAAGLTVIVLSSIQSLGTFEAFLLAVVFAGILQVLFGIAKGGLIAYYFPSSVIKGMLAAIGIILILKQIPHALGFDVDFEGDESFKQPDGHNTFTELYLAFKHYHPVGVFISAVSFALLLLWDTDKIKKIPYISLIPGALIAVVAGISINELLPGSLKLYDNHLVVLPRFNNTRELLSQLSFPDLSMIANTQVYVVAITIAIVASLETLLCVEATDKLDPYKRTTPTNRELIAQGAGNIVSGLIGGLPLTQVIVRSSANINSGAKTKAAAFFHGVLLLVCVLAIPGLLNKIPLACLAAILLLIGYKLAKIALFKEMYKLGWQQFIPFMVTIVAIVLTDLLKGIGIGLAVSVFYILRENFRNPYFLKKEHLHAGKKYTITLSDSVTFLNKGSILLALNEVPPNSEVVIDGSRSYSIDYDVLEIIHEFTKRAEYKNIKVGLIGIENIKHSSSGH